MEPRWLAQTFDTEYYEISPGFEAFMVVAVLGALVWLLSWSLSRRLKRRRAYWDAIAADESAATPIAGKVTQNSEELSKADDPKVQLPPKTGTTEK